MEGSNGPLGQLYPASNGRHHLPVESKRALYARPHVPERSGRRGRADGGEQWTPVRSRTTV